MRRTRGDRELIWKLKVVPLEVNGEQSETPFRTFTFGLSDLDLRLLSLTALVPCPPSPHHSYIGFDVYRTFFIGYIFSLSTALAFSVGRWGEQTLSLKRTVFLNRLFLLLVRLEPDDDRIRDETRGLRRSIRLVRFQVEIAQNRRSDVLIPTVRSLSLMKSPPAFAAVHEL